MPSKDILASDGNKPGGSGGIVEATAHMPIQIAMPNRAISTRLLYEEFSAFRMGLKSYVRIRIRPLAV
jgi:hypothetical protein